jgi:hypothetical protein
LEEVIFLVPVQSLAFFCTPGFFEFDSGLLIRPWDQEACTVEEEAKMNGEIDSFQILMQMCPVSSNQQSQCLVI